MTLAKNDQILSNQNARDADQRAWLLLQLLIDLSAISPFSGCATGSVEKDQLKSRNRQIPAFKGNTCRSKRWLKGKTHSLTEGNMF